MTAAAHAFPCFTQQLGSKAIQLASTPDTLKVGLVVAGSNTFNWVAATQAYTTYAQFIANAGTGGGGALTEVSASGYTAGGATLSGVTLTTSGLVTTFNATSPIVWTAGANWTANYAVFYDTSDSNELMCYWDFGGPVSVVSGGNFTLTISTSPAGIITLTSS